MSKKPVDLTLERVKRVEQGMLDMMAAQTAHHRNVTRLLEGLGARLDRIEDTQTAMFKEVRGVGSEVVLLSNRVEDAFTRIHHAAKRVDDLAEEAG